MTTISRSCQRLVHRRHSPCVYLLHPPSELLHQIAGAQVNIERGRLNAAMPGECSDFVNVPVRAREVRQTQMAQRVGSEPGKVRTFRDTSDGLRPGPDRDWLPIVAAGFGQEQRAAFMAQFPSDERTVERPVDWIDSTFGAHGFQPRITETARP